ncbi:MAG TPA: hypothetical protein VGG39_37715 [Polyangiaceae bacterium]
MNVFGVAVRLLRGERMRFLDRHGREWLATATELHLVRDGIEELIVEGYAADIAEEVVRRRAPGSRPPSQ